MQTINRTGGNLTIGCYRGTDPVRGNYIRDWTYSHAGQTCTMDCGESTGYLALFHGEIDPFWQKYNGWNDYELEIGPLPNDHQIVIVDRDGKLGYVDWSSVYAKWTRQETTFAADSTAVAASIQLAGSLISALGTGIAATGPLGAGPAGAVLGVGALILQELNKNVPQPPPPPDLDAIANAVETIVKDELNAAEATKAASTFLTIAEWLEEEAQTAHAAVWGHGAQPSLGDLSDHDETDFRGNLEEYCNAGGDFQATLDRMVRNPDQAKYILPALLVGVATSLQIRRLHEHVRHLDGAAFTDEEVQNYQAKARFYLDGLDSAVTALRAYVALKVQNENLQGTDEANTLTCVITKIHTGHDDLAFVDQQKQIIQRDIIASLDEDIADLKKGLQCKHFYNPEWDTHPRKKKQPPANGNTQGASA